MPDHEETTGSLSITALAQRAMDGDPSALTRLLERFTPPMLALARHRMDRRLREVLDPEDVVQDMWATALPKLPSLEAPDHHLSTPLLRFLGTILLNRLDTLWQKHVKGKPLRLAGGSEPDDDPAARLPAETSGVITLVLRREAASALHAALALLPNDDRTILLRRGIEHESYAALANETGVDEAALRMRYVRARRRLGELIPRSLAEDFASD